LNAPADSLISSQLIKLGGHSAISGRCTQAKMKPTFPRKNLAINNLIEFRSGSVIYDFTTYFKEKDPNDKKHLEFKVEHLHTLFELLEEEISQVIHTSNNKTITILFEELIANIEDFNLLTVDRQEFINKCNSWNEKKYSEFIKEVENDTNEYFDKPERKKYKHLEKYETYVPKFFDMMNLEKTTVTNKNFYCIEKTPRLIDIQFLDSYLKILEELTDNFEAMVKSHIKLYREGKLIDVSQKNLFERVKDKALNNKIIVGILIGMAILKGCDEIVKIANSNKEIYQENFDKNSENEIRNDSIK